jgi:glycosyltransferase involved in cell wall biosynthesis
MRARKIKFDEARKDVLFVIGSMAIGGAERQMVILAEGLAARGWKVRVFCLQASGPLLARLEAAGIHTIDGGYGRHSRLKIVLALSLCFACIKLLNELLIRRPSVLQGFLPLTNFISAVLGRVAFVKMIVTSKRALGFHQERTPAFRVLDRIANSLSNIITANAPEVATDAEQREGYSATSIVVIPNGIDFTRFDYTEEKRAAIRRKLELGDQEIAIVKVANLIPYKGHIELIEAFAMLLQSGLLVRLFLVGDDRGIRSSLESRVREIRAGHKIHFLGTRDDIPELLGAMDIGVVASHEEGLSNALIEKAAAGLPIVATDVGGNNQILRGLPNCMLVPPCKPFDMAEALKKIIGNDGLDDGDIDLRRRLTRQRYSLKAMVDAYEHLYLRA